MTKGVRPRAGDGAVGQQMTMAMRPIDVLKPRRTSIMRPSDKYSGIMDQLVQPKPRKAKKSHFKLITKVGVTAAVVICFVIGGILEATDTNVVAPDPVTFLQKQAAGYTLATSHAIDAWDPAQIEIKSSLILVVLVAFRLTLVPLFVAHFFAHLVAAKQAKIGNYIFEIFTTTTALVILSCFGGWQLLFDPAQFYPRPTPDQAWDLNVSMGWCGLIIMLSYLIGLAIEPNMRYELKLHHTIAIILILWATPALVLAKGSPRLSRLMASMFLYMVTEQNVFIGMLAYYSGVKQGWIFRASAWFYVATRAGITILCIVAFADLTSSDDDMDIWGTTQNSAFVFGWYAMSLPGVIGLSVVQVMSAMSLFGIARKVAKDNRVIEESEEENDDWKPILLEVYNEIYKGGHIDLTRKPFVHFLQNDMHFDLAFPAFVFEALFDDMDTMKSGVVAWEQFQAYMAKFCVRSDVRLSLQLMLLQIAVSHDSADIYTEAFITGLAAEHSRLLEELEDVDAHSKRLVRPSSATKLEGMRAGMTSALLHHSDRLESSMRPGATMCTSVV
jgi:hypothetical protein